MCYSWQLVLCLLRKQKSLPLGRLQSMAPKEGFEPPT